MALFLWPEQRLIHTPDTRAIEKEKNTEQHEHERMLVFVPKPAMAHNKRDERKCANE